MRVKTTKIDGSKVRVDATLTSDETKSALDASRSSIIEELDLKVDLLHPADQLAKEQFGLDNFDAIVAVEMVDTLILAAINQTGIIPAFIPEAQHTALPKEGRAYSFNFVITPKPEFELPSYEPVTVEVNPIEISDDQVKKVMTDIALRCMSDDEENPGSNPSDEWIVAHLPFESGPEDIKAIIQEQLIAEAEEKRLQRIRELATVALAKRLEAEIPQDILDATQMSVFEDLRMELARQGIKADDFFRGREQVFKAQIAQRAFNTLAQGYALDAVFKHEGLTLEDEDVDAWCTSIARDADAQSVRKEMEAAGKGFLMREGAQRLKAGNWLARQAIVVEKS